MEINRDIVRWILLIGALPIWWPFVKILWRDFNEALKEEGGLMGSAPTARELERMRAERGPKEEGLESEPLVRPGDVRQPRLRSGSAAPRRNSGQQRPRGFR